MVAAAPALPPRYVLTPPGDTRPSLLVQHCPEVNDNVLNDLRQAMFDDGCANGIAVDPRRIVVLRDTHLSMSLQSIEQDFVLDTPKLLPGSADLELRLSRWLEPLTRNWQEAIPHERWAAPLLADVVPAAAGAVIRRSFSGRGPMKSRSVPDDEWAKLPSCSIHAAPMPYIRLDGAGVAWIEHTNVKVIEVVLDQHVHGWSPEEIHVQHPDLSMAQIHAALAWYYDHQVELDADIDRRLRDVEERMNRSTDSPLRRRIRGRQGPA